MPRFSPPGGEFRNLRRGFRLTLASQAVHQQVDNRQNQRQSDQALCRHTTRELRHIVCHRCHEVPRALPEDQIDQHDRENGDEAELDDLPQDLCCVGHEFAHGKNLSMTHTSEGGELRPPPGLRLAKLIRPAERGRQAIFRFENSQSTMPRVMRPTRPFPPMSFTQAIIFAVTAPKNGKLAPTNNESTIANASSISASSVNAPTHSLMVSIPFIAESP